VADQAAQAVHGRRALTVTLIVVSGAPGTGSLYLQNAAGARVVAGLAALAARAIPSVRPAAGAKVAVH
jgi:hypothetical protein